MTVAGGQAMAALAGGKLWQRIQVRPNERYLLLCTGERVRGLITGPSAILLWSTIDGHDRAGTNQRDSFGCGRQSERLS